MNSVSVEIESSRGKRVVSLRSGARFRLGSKAGAADVVLEREPGLDPHHLTLSFDGKCVWIEDCGSVSGTYVNGKRIRRQELRASVAAKAAGVTIRIAGAAAEPVPGQTAAAAPVKTAVTAKEEPKVPLKPRLQPIPERRPEPAKTAAPPRPAPPPASSAPARTPAGLAISEWPADEPAAFRTGAGERLYAILDLARDRRIHRAILTHSDKFENLYEGKRALQFTAVAPYLLEFEKDSKLFRYLRKTGWGNSWGIYVISPQDFQGVRHHLRRFLMVRMANGKNAYFRFYDPRVLRTFLPVCEPEQATELFASVSAFVAESDNPAHAKRYEFTARPAPYTQARGWRGR